MGTGVVFTADPASVLKMAREVLASQPVLNNLVLSLLHARTAHPEPGRYWLATEHGKVVGVVLQSPLTIAATLTPMDGRVVEVMVRAIVDAGISLPGVSGDATTAASFAGHWSERRKSAVTPLQGTRLYEWVQPGEATNSEGRLRPALPSDRSLMIEWTRGFSIEIGELADDTELRVDRSLAAAELWLWDDGETMSMAVGRKPAEGIVRISGSTLQPTSGIGATLRRAFMRFRSICAMPAFAAYFTPTWPIRHPIRFTAALAIGRWQKVFATALSNWQANVLNSRRSADPKPLIHSSGVRQNTSGHLMTHSIVVDKD